MSKPPAVKYRLHNLSESEQRELESLHRRLKTPLLRLNWGHTHKHQPTIDAYTPYCQAIVDQINALRNKEG